MNFFTEKLNKNRADEEENFFDKNNNKIFKVGLNIN